MTGSSLLVCALAAYSVHEHQEGHVSEIGITLAPGRFTLEDDGRGIGRGPAPAWSSCCRPRQRT